MKQKRQKQSHFIQLSYPQGMAISQEGHLIVTEWGKHRITIINTDSGEVISRFGNFSSEQEFKGLEGVALTQDGHIIVADTSNDRLHTVKNGVEK